MSRMVSSVKAQIQRRQALTVALLVLAVVFLFVVILTTPHQVQSQGSSQLVGGSCAFSIDQFYLMAESIGESSQVAEKYHFHYCGLAILRDSYLHSPVVDHEMLEIYLARLQDYQVFMRLHPLLGTEQHTVMPSLDQLSLWFLLMRQAMAFSSLDTSWQVCGSTEVEVDLCEHFAVTTVAYRIEGISTEERLAIYIATVDFETGRSCQRFELADDPTQVWTCPWGGLFYRPVYSSDTSIWVQFLETGQIWLRENQRGETS